MSAEQSLVEANKRATPVAQPVAYEAPAIESVITPESLQREVHYAGLQASSNVAAA